MNQADVEADSGESMMRSLNRKWKLKQNWIKLSLSILGLVFLTTFALNTSRRETAAIPRKKHSFHKKSLSKKIKNWGIFNSKANSHIDALDAWEIEDGSRNVVVAVIDTGIDVTHPDLQKNIWHTTKPMKNCSSGSGLRPFRNLQNKSPKKRRIRPVSSTYGWDYIRNQPNPKDSHGHGTHVAGIIGAIANPVIGISGVAQEVSLMAIKYYSRTNSGITNLKNTVRSILCAIENGAMIINYSGGGPEYSHEEYLAIKKAESKGVLVVAAAGNERQNVDLKENYYYPAAYHLSNVISVAATDIRNNILPSSNWGKSVDVAAPGQDIYSTLPNGRYGRMTGTSQATAFVTGIAALILSQNPRLKPHEVIKIIRQSVVPVPGLRKKVATGGHVSALRALLRLNNGKVPENSFPGIIAYRPGSITRLLKIPVQPAIKEVQF